jgi:hypothetical protein
MKFEEIYPTTPDYLKLKFLDAIMAQNNKLQKEFEAFAQAESNEKSEFSYDTFLTIVHSVKTAYQEDFENVDCENPDWDNYQQPHSGYIEEWEAYQYAAEQEFESIFDRFRFDATDRIIMQKAEELLAMFIGLYQATQEAQIANEIGSFENINEYLLSEHTNTIDALVEKLWISAFAENVILAAFDLFFTYCDTEYPENPHFANHFEQLLIALADKSAYATRLLDTIDQSDVERQFLPELVLLLNKKTGNSAEWLLSARQFYRQNTEVAKQLLEYYFETGKEAFLEIARELVSTNKRFWAGFLQQYVSPELDEKLFVCVFRQLVVQHKEIEYYNKIRKYLSEDGLTELLNEMKGDKVFIVKILEVEQRYKDIKTLVEQNPSDWEYAAVITPILTVYPEFCLRNIKSIAESTLQNNRGRSVYERVALWLKMTQNIPGFEMEKLDLVRTLYNHKPNLPAMKDEMRKAGLVK